MDDMISKILNFFKSMKFDISLFSIIILLICTIEFIYLNIDINRKLSKSFCNASLIVDNENISESNNNISDELGEIYVDVKGEVNSPGVYKLSNNSKVIDAINASGGTKKNANTRFINLSKTLSDGDVIVVYSNKEIDNAKKSNLIYVETPCVCEEVKNDACYIENNISNDNDLIDEVKTNSDNINKININSASKDELMSLSGIGESKAKAIINYREENGIFNKIEDIINVSGISESLFSKIKESITV